jgi:DNA-binding transcriptional MerR regulator
MVYSCRASWRAVRMVTDGRAYLQIGEVAERTGVTQRTLRFYEEKGLLKAPSRMEGGFRLYSEEDVRRVEQIRRLQSLLGFSLAEIKEMVEAEEELEQLREEARNSASDAEQGRRSRLQRAIEITDWQCAVIRQKVEQLAEMERSMEAKLLKYRARLAALEETDAPAEVARPS